MDYFYLLLCAVTLGLVENSRASLSEKLSDFGLTVPFSTDSRGRYVSHALSSGSASPLPSERRRVARSAPAASSRYLFFNVTVFGRELHLRLRANRRLVAPGAFAEWHEDFEEKEKARINNDCLFTGDVSDMPEASVAISNCDGLAGLIRTDSGEFFIEPLQKGQQESEVQGRVHVVYPRSAVKRQNQEDLHNEVPDFGIAELPNTLDLVEQKLSESDRKRRHAKKDDYSIEVLLAVDDSVVRFHGKEHVQNYVLTLMNIVDEIYHDESLGTSINIVIVRMIMVGYRQSVSLIERGNPSRSLEQVCRWANTQQRLDPNHAEHHDHAIFLSRQDFGPAGMQGYAPVTGMCHPLRSCTLNHEDGFSSAFVVAHETGHVLGMEHDGQGNRCGDETSMGSIMAPLVQAAFHRYHWSRCSKQELNRYLHSYDCLLDDPFEHKWPKLPELPGINYSMDEQCRFDFGVGYTMCTAFRTYDPCKQLWCSHPDNQYFCKTKKGPPVDGTECAPGKWCFKGHCIWRSADQLYGHDGGWSSWGRFGSCSRSCGGGVRSRSRQCNNPPPAYGGRECPGSEFDYRICNTEDCPGAYEDFRAQQCVQRSNKYHNSIKHTWLPYEHPQEDRKCELSCRSKETGEVVFMNQVMHDGTRCSYTDPFSVCARGECLHVGCDKEVGSYKQEDKCGVCEGDNSHCRTVKLTLTKTPKLKGLLKVFDIPSGARHIVIEESASSPHLMAVKSQVTGSFILNAKGDEVKSKTFIESGLEWEYTIEGDKETLKTTGPLNEGIVVLVVPKEEDRKISLSYKYIIHEDLVPIITNNNVLLSELDSYDWALKSWTQCTKPCGGGVQYTKYGCRRKSDGHLVQRTLCDVGKRPKPIRKRCNVNDCSPPTWITEDWGACSKSCGQLGVQSRVVQCVQPQHNGTHRVLHTKYCSSDKPPTHRVCNTTTPCPAQWRTGAWSQCSVTCGEGIKQRQVVCRSSENTSAQCEGEKPESVSICKLSPCPGEPSLSSPTADSADNYTTDGEVNKISNEPCLHDKSIFCQMEVSARYCSIPGYNKLCCESCNKKMGNPTAGPRFYTSSSVEHNSSNPRPSSANPSILPTTPSPLTVKANAKDNKPNSTAPSLLPATPSPNPDDVSSQTSPLSGSPLPPEPSASVSPSTSTSTSISINATRQPSQDLDRKTEKAEPHTSTLSSPTLVPAGTDRAIDSPNRNLTVVT
ncbi:A disintegrin and metalloproteinase with thrombospondin motifs 14 isoform X1 [Pangasianodon hypophthalmus]|uniref:A disintegrin and metalloproteinase with thrombospondin motifs 14 isoform X1 n=1 Tax=Pangasianodon hypophthalmus TaxID=310915 RepID=UPI002306E518|nr:A disintegrin and metalloproteinase with thrombospondin motifs 14 isoform X1 [Pangasianodon hypophthalmus]